MRPSCATGAALKRKLFATRYKLVLPTEEQLRLELIREQRLLEEQTERSQGGVTSR